MKKTICVIPVKDLENSKLRLSQILNDEQRKQFSVFMLKDVINTLEKVGKIKKIIITTPLKSQIDSDNYKKVEIIQDTVPNINKAIENAIKFCKRYEIDLILILPADIPLIKETDIEELFTSKEENNAQILIVPSNRGDGTNCLLFDADLKIKTHFGKKSFKIHKNKFNQRFRTHVLKLFRIGLDIDYKSDLKTLNTYSKIKKRASQRYIKKICPSL
ncbi:MAG: 2-phospho-L-lactate guanylyltransferase [Candidatus Lokiarchaeota archaeon]|nr:2-phospho-L-lactate guanylyltransferase [Candidatus Lokiarchaeota archaeon]